MALSIILAYHQEGQSFLEECINQIRSSIHIAPCEIIVVDDCSSTPLEPIQDVTIVRHNERKGVGQAFDTGVMNCTYENIILTAPDMRFIDNGWAEKILQEIDKYPKSIVCTTCVGLEPHNQDINVRRHVSKRCGATILIFHDHKSNPRQRPNFRGLVEAQWLPYKEGDSYEVPCVLGACYAVKKEWYNWIDGFWGHRSWGNLEPLISMKSYLFGGSCRVVPSAETGHIFKPKGANIHGTPQEAILYNKLLISRLLFDDSERLINFLGDDLNVRTAKKIFGRNVEAIARKRLEYLDKIVFPMVEYISKFNIDYRK